MIAFTFYDYSNKKHAKMRYLHNILIIRNNIELFTKETL